MADRPLTVEAMKGDVHTAIIVSNQDGMVIFVNAPFERLFGWPAEDIVGQPLLRVIPARFRDAHNLGFARFVTSGHPTLMNRPLALQALHRDGSEFAAEHYLIAERSPQGWVFAASIRPISAR